VRQIHPRRGAIARTRWQPGMLRYITGCGDARRVRVQSLSLSVSLSLCVLLFVCVHRFRVWWLWVSICRFAPLARGRARLVRAGRGCGLRALPGGPVRGVSGAHTRTTAESPHDARVAARLLETSTLTSSGSVRARALLGAAAAYHTIARRVGVQPSPSVPLGALGVQTVAPAISQR
jgi:hypothetical protein